MCNNGNRSARVPSLARSRAAVALAGLGIVLSGQGAAEGRSIDPEAPATTQPAATIGGLEDFGVPATIISRRVDPANGATVVRFASGARLIVKPTLRSPGEVSVVVAFGNGRAGVPKRLVHALWATILLPLGGTGRMSYSELQNRGQRNQTPLDLRFMPGATAFEFKGNIPVASLGSELELIGAYARDPGFAELLGREIDRIGPLIARQVDVDPATRFMRAVQHRLYGVRYQEVPQAGDIPVTTGTDVRDALTGPLASAADIAVVGDVDVDSVIAVADETVAAGAVRQRIETAAPRMQVLPAEVGRGGPRPVVASGAVWFGMYWRLRAGASPVREARIAEVAAVLIEHRLREALSMIVPDVRPMVRADQLAGVSGSGYLGIAISVPYNRVAEVRSRITSTLQAIGSASFDRTLLAQANARATAKRSTEGLGNAALSERLVSDLRGPRRPIEANLTAGPVQKRELERLIRCDIDGQSPVVVIE